MTPLTFQFSSPAAALTALLGQIRPVDVETVQLEDALGRVLAQDVGADRPSPAVDLSSMDGFALRFADLSSAASGNSARLAPILPIAGEVRIGQEPPALPPVACLRIVTGGAIPAGADAVAKREDVTEHPGHIEINPAASIQRSENIRRKGENLGTGAIAVARGTRITPAVAGALAALGVSRPAVHRTLTVGVITTGDELVGINETPTPWQLRDSNAAALHAVLDSLRIAEVRQTRVPDDESRLREAIASHLKTCDAVLLTGGVSMGHRDYVADALEAVHVRTVFHGVPQRPGKPILAGVTEDGRPVLALPGNPVSVLVTARRIAAPALLARGGMIERLTAPPGVAPSGGAPSVLITNPDAKTIQLWWHRPVRLSGRGEAQLVDPRSSGDILTTARSDGFIEMPPQHSGVGPWPFYAWSC